MAESAFSKEAEDLRIGAGECFLGDHLELK